MPPIDAATEPAIFWFDPEPGPGAAPGRKLGLTVDFLDSLPGDLLGVELLPVNSRLRAGDSLGFAHAATRSLDLRVPFALRVVEINSAVLADPRVVSESPENRGWLIKFATV